MLFYALVTEILILIIELFVIALVARIPFIVVVIVPIIVHLARPQKGKCEAENEY